MESTGWRHNSNPLSSKDGVRSTGGSKVPYQRGARTAFQLYKFLRVKLQEQVIISGGATCGIAKSVGDGSRPVRHGNHVSQDSHRHQPRHECGSKLHSVAPPPNEVVSRRSVQEQHTTSKPADSTTAAATNPSRRYCRHAGQSVTRVLETITEKQAANMAETEKKAAQGKALTPYQMAALCGFCGITDPNERPEIVHLSCNCLTSGHGKSAGKSIKVSI